MANSNGAADERLVSITRPSGHIVQLELNRPAKLNAFNNELREQFRAAIHDVAHDADVRVLVITGSGRSFSVGADLQVVGAGVPNTAEDDRQRLLNGTLELFLDVWRLPIPVIAKVNGFCMGIATILVNCCDVVVIDEEAKVGWPVLPLGGGMVSPTWVWHVGMHKAKEMSYRVGATMTGREAAEYGFANYAFPAGRLDAQVLALARDIARVERDLLALKKSALNQVFGRLGFEDAVRAGAAYDALGHSTQAAAGARESMRAHGRRGAMEAFGAPEFFPEKEPDA
jgi:enoyl-CoA hydratase/carnithine racemase